MRKNLKNGAKLWIRPLGKNIEYLSQVSEILSDTELEIFIPTEKSRIVLLTPGEEYEMLFVTDRGSFSGNIKILKRKKVENIYLARVKLTSELKRNQRRTHFRQLCNIHIKFCCIDEEELESIDKQFEIENSKMNIGIAIDISGGGCRFVSGVKVEAGSIIILEFKLMIKGKFVEYELLAKVLMSEPVENNKLLQEYRVQFHMIDEKLQEEIIQYVFDEQCKKKS